MIRRATSTATYLLRELLVHVPIMFGKVLLAAIVTATFVTWSAQTLAGGFIWIVPASYWIDDAALTIPNFSEGDDPLIYFDRTVSQAFNGRFVMEVHALDEPPGREPCRADGIATYQPNALNQFSALFSRYTRGCEPGPGLYQIQNVITFPVLDHEKSIVVTSNVFCVSPAGLDPSTWCDARNG